MLQSLINYHQLWQYTAITRGTQAPLGVGYTYVYTDARFLLNLGWLRTTRK